MMSRFIARHARRAIFGLLTLPAAVFAQAVPVSPAADAVDGSQLYTANCVACHQVDGKGLANLAPALKGNPIVAGDPAVLIQILLKGPAAVLPADRPHFGASTMDSFYYKMTDDEIAAVLTYVRQNFGKNDKSAVVNAKDVAAARAAIDSEGSK